jgi:hypothetical protein
MRLNRALHWIREQGLIMHFAFQDSPNAAFHAANSPN